jgi:hypothetical protein
VFSAPGISPPALLFVQRSSAPLITAMMMIAMISWTGSVRVDNHVHAGDGSDGGDGKGHGGEDGQPLRASGILVSVRVQ